MENQENSKSFAARMWIYQKERFPLFGHGPLIAAFSFSAISYARICRGMDTFVELPEYLAAFFISFTLFFLLRVFDEFKDNADDIKYRTYLPIPRGLISLKELRVVGVVVFALQLILLGCFYPTMLPYYGFVVIWLYLMGKEFFVPEWLKDRPVLYMTSHMFIIPLIDILASSFDWRLSDVAAPNGLIFFFLVSYFNGIVIEFGRKIKIPEDEEEGVTSYSGLYGPKRATIYWMIVLFITLFWAIAASYFAGFSMIGYLLFVVFFGIAIVPGFMFLKNMTKKNAKRIEIMAGVWTLLMYLTLGAVPMISKMF